MKPNKPRYNFDLDFTTNSTSYYETLEKLNQYLKALSNRLGDVENHIQDLLIDWVEDGTLKVLFEDLRGDQGPKGDKGDKGDQGVRGPSGPIGPAGERGEQGVQGVQGTEGAKGDRGIQGIQGIKGDKGEKGDRGDSGVTAPISGMFTLSGDSEGNLFVDYVDNQQPPQFEVDSNGDIYYLI